MTVMAGARVEADKILNEEEADAWQEYLEACQRAGDRYDAVEAWAWLRLRTRIRAVEARRRRLAP